MKSVTGNAKLLLKKSELEPISTEDTVKHSSSVGVGQELLLITHYYIKWRRIKIPKLGPLGIQYFMWRQKV